MNIDEHQFLGVQVNLLNMAQLNCLIEQAIKLEKQYIIANHNLNSVYIHQRSSIMQDFYRIANYVHVDGMALILLGKLLGIPCRREHRVTYADWVWSLMEQAEKNNWRVMYLGSAPGFAEQGAKILNQIYPKLQIDTHHGYFSTEPSSLENQKVIEEIEVFKPHILMVGMGMPRQEKWILENYARISSNIILPCGACIDYIAGKVSTPPRWMGKVGLEWFYRLITEPKRLWKRYLFEPWFIVYIFSKEYLAQLMTKFFVKSKKIDLGKLTKKN